MNVTIECKTNARFAGTVYAMICCANEVLTSATLDYCISKCENEGWRIENAHDVLLWLHENADFKAYK